MKRWMAGAALLIAVGALARAPDDDAEFEKRVRPTLAARCVACHGPAVAQGGLRLDRAISAEQARQVAAAVRYDGAVKMPPGGKLTGGEIAAIDAWVKRGAPWPKSAPKPAATLWSLRPVRRPVTPAGVHPVDALLGTARAPQADRRTLIRRVTYDLTGLPPTAAQVDAFAADKDPKAYERLVDRLLASSQYGEQWGRHWLDIVRYADTAGENSDHPLPHAWRYRNGVIDALNRNVPYDRFVAAQIAGDLMPGAGAEGIVATGYLAIARRFGHDIDQDMHLTYEDAIDTLGKSLLGLSLGCARCHDHKFDPVSQKDYYGLYGIFQSTALSFPGCEPRQQPHGLVPLVAPLPAGKTLAEGAIADGGAAEMPALRVAVRRGDVLELQVSPSGNHGADTTRVAWTLEADGRRWSVDDLIDTLGAGNPNGVWSFLDAQTAAPLFLGGKRAGVDGQSALTAWSRGDTPSVLANASPAPVTVWTALPPRAFFVHPGPSGPVAVAWTSPIDGTVTVSGKIADAHPGGPNGVGWSLAVRPGAGAALAARVGQDDAPLAYAATEGKPVDARLQRRGEPADPGDTVPRKFLAVLGDQRVQDRDHSGRLELARWIVDPRNPLTARVWANRVWGWHFGKGIVATPNDFGTRGAPPTHPALLDWLASELVRSGWDTKALHRTIVTSAAYRAAAFPRRRLSAEELRDTLLFVTGELDPTPGGPHPFPPEASWAFSQHAPFAAEYETNRRSVYVLQKRNRRTRFFALFDGADPNASTPVRDRTTVPTQALYFMNDPFVHERAARLAAQVADLGLRPGIVALHRRVFGRSPAPPEAIAAELFLTEGGDGRSEDWQALARVLLSSNEMLYVD